MTSDGKRTQGWRTCAVSAGDVEGVALVTDAAEHPEHVLTPAVHAQVPEHLTLVDVCNNMRHELQPSSVF